MVIDVWFRLGMLEKRFPAVPPQSFTTDGTANGAITILDTTLFKVKQAVYVAAVGQPTLDNLEVKKIIDQNNMIVGPKGAINLTSNLSAYTMAASAVIFCPAEQLRPAINWDEYDRATYAEEPIVARRVHQVDQFGDSYSTTNPMPVTSDPGWDEIDLSYDANQNLSTVDYHKGTIVETLTLTYDANQNLSKVVKS